MFSSSDAVLDPETDTVFFSVRECLYSWPVGGELVETIPLPVNGVYPRFAYGEYYFYTDTSAFGPGHVVNLETGEDTLLGVYQPLNIVDGKLLVLEQGAYDENGEDHKTDEWNYYLMDKAGKVEPYAWPEEGFWVETDVYYSRGRILYDARSDEPEELLSFDRHLPTTRGMVNGVLVMQTSENMELVSDRITMVDATGENAERVAEANETRHFLVGTDTVTLALMPDGTLYLLQAGEPETGWCVVTG